MTTSETTTTPETAQAPSPADALCERLFGSAIGFTEVLSAYLGDRLGLCRSLGELGAATSGELAAHAGIAERYAREWLEHEAPAGILVVAEPSTDGMERRYRLPDGCAGALTDPEDLANILPLTRAFVAVARQVDRVAEALPQRRRRPLRRLRSGAGRRPGRDQPPGLRAPARRLACGGGPRRARAVAGAAARARRRRRLRRCVVEHRARPRVPPHHRRRTRRRRSVRRARPVQRRGSGPRRARAREALDGARIADGQRYDLVTIFEAVHDLALPVEVLRRVRQLVADDGAVLVMDENVGESFEQPGPVDAFMYAASFMLCLPAALAEDGAVGIGTVMRPATLERYAREAGFSATEVLPIEHSFFRLYWLRP